MEQHPVPRNISSFQFHLIGDMTLRQFAYLAVGIASAYFTYKTAPFPVIFKFPLAGIFGLTGFAFAFLPIQDRPLDKWVVAFIKSITSPTQYSWVKNNPPMEILTRHITLHQQVNPLAHAEIHKEANSKLSAYLASLPKQPHEVINVREKKYIDATLALFQTSATFATLAPTAPIVVSISTPVVAVPKLSTAVQADIPKIPVPIQSQPLPTSPSQPSKPAISQTDKKEAQEKPVSEKAPQENPPFPSLQPVASITNQPKVDFLAMQKQLTELAAEKKILEEQLVKLRTETVSIKTPESQVIKPVMAKEETKEPTIKTISPKSVVSEIGATNFFQYPNIITGVIKDPQKKILPNIIITIKNKDGSPLRALKTNKLGQFATATPLPNGTYRLEIEDPLKHFMFDIAEIALSGKILLPIEIVAKGEKELIREKLTKELFGSGNANI